MFLLRLVDWCCYVEGVPLNKKLNVAPTFSTEDEKQFFTGQGRFLSQVVKCQINVWNIRSSSRSCKAVVTSFHAFSRIFSKIRLKI